MEVGREIGIFFILILKTANVGHLHISNKALDYLVEIKLADMNSLLTINFRIWLNQCVGVGCSNSALYQVFNFKLVKFWQLVVVLNIGIIDGRVEL